MKKFLEEFKEFALKGNVMDMAVGVIIGAAFQSIVSSLVDDVISPLLGTLCGNNFDSLSVVINGATLNYGKFITSIINFIIMAFVLFMIVKGINEINHVLHTEKKAEPLVKSDELVALEKIISLLEEQNKKETPTKKATTKKAVAASKPTKAATKSPSKNVKKKTSSTSKKASEAINTTKS